MVKIIGPKMYKMSTLTIMAVVLFHIPDPGQRQDPAAEPPRGQAKVFSSTQAWRKTLGKSQKRAVLLIRHQKVRVSLGFTPLGLLSRRLGQARICLIQDARFRYNDLIRVTDPQDLLTTFWDKLGLDPEGHLKVRASGPGRPTCMR